MGHGDDKGLVLPPVLAPTQVVILVVKDDEASLAAAERLQEQLLAAGVRVKVDRRTDQGFGRRVTDWELKGVPVRLEVGPRDLGEGVVTLARRDGAERQRPTLETVASLVPSLLRQMQADLLQRGQERLRARTVDVSSVQEAAEAARTGFARIPWRTLGVGGEAELAQNAVTVRCLQRPDGSLPEADDEDDLVAIVARSY
jgi:prolyl-tRNA synthetase